MLDEDYRESNDWHRDFRQSVFMDYTQEIWGLGSSGTGNRLKDFRLVWEAAAIRPEQQNHSPQTSNVPAY